MTRFVFLLLAIFVACSQAREGTLVDSCKGICESLGDFLQNDPCVHKKVPEWLEEKGFMGAWDCNRVMEVTTTFGKEMEDCKANKSEDDMAKIAMEMNKALQEMAEPMANAIAEKMKSDEKCIKKYEEIMDQII